LETTGLWWRIENMRFRRGEEGQGLVEYALVLVLVAVVVIAILALLGPFINDWITGALEWLEQVLGT
jgi:pilus assembly protein Flp/PilA